MSVLYYYYVYCVIYLLRLHTVVVWKSTNVGMSTSDSVVRPAAPPLEQWLHQKYPTRSSRVLSSLTTDAAGLVFVSLNDAVEASGYSFLKFGYVAVVRTDTESAVWENSEEICFQEETSASEGKCDNLTVTQLHATGQLTLVRVVGSGPLLTSPEELREILTARGLHVLPKFMALVQLTVRTNSALPSGKSQHVGTVVTATVETPRKFYKHMHREHLFHLRRCELASPPSPSRISTAKFQGLDILYPSTGSLQPRESSAVLVDAARRLLAMKVGSNPGAGFMMRGVLDLGTGSGALLLSLLASLNPYVSSLPRGPYDDCTVSFSPDEIPSAPSAHHSTVNDDCSGGDIVMGVGVDINSEAISLAKQNAEVHLSKEQVSFVRFFEGSFAELDQLHRQLLDKIVQKSANAYQGFDIVMCNPPFLSVSASRDRVTSEGADALVAGSTGYEAYEIICCSLRSAIDNNSVDNHPLLKPCGRLIFQISAAAGAVQRVTSIVAAHGFYVDEVLVDTRVPGRKAVRRGIVCIPLPSTSRQYS